MPNARNGTRKRRDSLLDLLAAGEANVNDLARAFGVSASTVRRDLRSLQAQGSVQRTHGGATVGHPPEARTRDKALANGAEKASLAKAAAKMVSPGDLVLLDAGTTCGQIAVELAGRNDITIMTNGLSALNALADALVDVVVIGGRLRRPNESFIGARVIETLRDARADITFIGADAVDADLGLNYPDLDQVLTKRAMVAHSCRAVAVVDQSKLATDQNFPYWFDARPSVGLLTNALEGNAAEIDHLRARGWTVDAV